MTIFSALLSVWNDLHKLLARARGQLIDPIVDDLLARILPGLVLLFGIAIVKQGFGVTLEFVSAFSSWLTIAATLLLAWLLGRGMLEIGRAARYARPPEPEGWSRDLWEEGVRDFHNRAPQRLRTRGFWLQICSEGTAALGTGLFFVLVTAVLVLHSAWGSGVLGLFFLAMVCLLIHENRGWPWALAAAAIFTALLLCALFRVSSPWSRTIPALLLGITLLHAIHVIAHLHWHQTVLQIIRLKEVRTIGKARPVYLGQQGFGDDDHTTSKSRYQDVYDAVCENPYYRVWGIGGQLLPVYETTLSSILKGVFRGGRSHQFRAAAQRVIDSRAVLRPGPDGRGYRRLLHPNGVCLFGTWEITEATGYTGYFRDEKKALVIARYSAAAAPQGRFRSLSLVGKLYPTDDPHAEVLTANFITQQDIGGERSAPINDADLRNAPNTTVWRRGFTLDGLPVILATGLIFNLVDRQSTNRQLYEIAELNEPGRTRTPEFMRLVVDEHQPRITGAGLDFRDEILGQIYDPGDPVPRRQLVFHIEVSDTGDTFGPAFFQRRRIREWRRIGRLVFHEAVASYNGDFVLHFHHPAWRADRDNPQTTFRRATRGKLD